MTDFRFVPQQSPYGRQQQPPSKSEVRRPQSPPSTGGTYDGPTYYDLPVIKQPHYGELAAAYLFVGGIAGSSQLIAQIVDMVGCRDDDLIVSRGRYVAMAGVAISPLLLTADLHVPTRWYNMLRIFRRTSAISIGSWTLTVFGISTALTAMAQATHELTGITAFRRMASLLGIPAAASGAGMSFYTGSLLAASQVPIWWASGRSLPVLFATSAFNNATATLMLSPGMSERPGSFRRLQQLAATAAIAESFATVTVDRTLESQHVDKPLTEQRATRLMNNSAKLLGVATPLLIHGVASLSGRGTKRTALAAAAGTLLGGWLMRRSIVKAGVASSTRPVDYFQLTQASDSHCGNTAWA